MQRGEPLSVKPLLDQAVEERLLTGFNLANPIWPRPENQSANRAAAQRLLSQRNTVRSAVLANGFTETAFGLANGIFDTWQRATETRGVFWPTNEMDRWIFDKLVARTPTNFYAVGFLYQCAAWCYGDQASNGDRHADLYRREAIASYERALTGDVLTGNRRAHVTYLVGELNRRLGDTQRADRWLRAVAGVVAADEDGEQLAALAERQRTAPTDTV